MQKMVRISCSDLGISSRTIVTSTKQQTPAMIPFSSPAGTSHPKISLFYQASGKVKSQLSPQSDTVFADILTPEGE